MQGKTCIFFYYTRRLKVKRKLIFIIISILIIIFITIYYKNLKNGNDISNKSADEIKEYILNMKSYYAIAEITIKSNKNENKYKVKQQYSKNNYKQEILEPEKISGIQFIYNEGTLYLKNSKLNLNKIYENYTYIESNELSLMAFIEDYKNSDKTQLYEKDDEIILEVNIKNNNKYVANKKLYINKTLGKIEKLEIIDKAQNTRIYILYNEITINTLQKEEMLAFSIKEYSQDI